MSTSTDDVAVPRPGPSRHVLRVWGTALGLGLLAVLVRLPALHQPLDRDMGAHAAMGAYWADGLLPYVDAIDNKQPLPYVVYAVLAMIRPHSATLIRLAGFVVAACAVVALVLLARRVIGLRRAALAGTVVAVVGATRWVQGVDLNTEHLLALTGTLAVLVPLAFPGRRGAAWWLLCGSLSGLAALSKAPGALFAVPALLALLVRAPEGPTQPRDRPATVAWFVLGALLPGVPFLVAYGLAGHADDLVFWNLTYNLAYSGSFDVPWWRWLVPVRDVRPIVLLAFTAAAVLVVRARRTGADRTGLTLLAWLVTAYVGARIGQRDFPHYYAPIVAPAALSLVLPGSWSLPDRARDLVVTAAVSAALTIGFGVDVAGQLGSTGDELAVRLYRATQAGAWIRHGEVGTYLREVATSGDELYVVGNEPGFYWSSGLPPANPHLLAAPGDVLPGWARTHAADLAADPPEFVVQPYGDIVWPEYARPLEDLPYEPVARFGPVTVMRLRS